MSEKTAEKKAAPAEAPASAHRYEDRTVDELQDLAEERGLAKSGTKAELVARLRGESPADSKVARRECVVDEDFHVGRAVNGLVCSYHAMHYLADGTPRGK